MKAHADAAFETWLQRQLRYSVTAMLRSVSAVDLVKERPGFGQTMRPVRGSILASPVPAAYDPDPDYFFHWFRDSAVVIDALRLAVDLGLIAEQEGRRHLGDFVGFSLVAQRLDGGEAAARDRQSRTVEEFRKFLRDDAELVAVRGDRVVAESRINPDGTLDLTRWARPQHDGPPLRALALLRWARRPIADKALAADAASLIRADLDFTLDHWREPSFDIWEEDCGHHYYTLRLAAAALEEGAGWLDARDESSLADRYRDDTATIQQQLDGYWLADAGHYRSRFADAATDSAKALDIAVILAAIHAGGRGERHSVQDPRMQATLARLDAAFETRYPINHGRQPGRGLALGRYAADRYYGGGAWYVATLAAAEFCFRAAAKTADAAAWIARGDAYLATVRAFTPADGALSEQFDPASGAQLSAKHLAWSYAAFISCIATRRAALAAR